VDILICTTAYNTTITGAGGFARIFGEWGIRNASHHVHILSEDCGDESDTHHICKIGYWSKVPIVSYYFKSRQYGRCLKRLLAQRKFDVIYFNDIWLAYGSRHLISGLKGQVTTVAFMHDDNTMDMPQSFRLNGAAFSHLMRWWLERSVIGCLDTILVNSEYLKSRMLKKLKLSENKIRRLYYAAHDYAQIAFKPKNIDPAKPVRIVFIKHDFMRGGLQDLLAALRLLREYQFTLTIAGAPKARIFRKIKPALLNQAHVKIDIRGHVTKWSEVQELFYTHDICCVPSRREALGLANAEAMASGTAVVTTTAGGIPEVLNKDENGYACKPGDVKKLANAISTCISQTSLTNTKVAAGRIFVLERFALNSMFTALENILTELWSMKQQERVRSGT